MGRSRLRRGIAGAALAACVLAIGGAAPAGAASTNEQVLRVNIGTMPGSLDPGRAANVEDLVVMNALFTPLYRSPGGPNGRLQPWLATGAPAVSDDGLHYTVRLRSATWTDGRPVTAADVVFAFNRARTMSPFGTQFGAVRRVTSVGQRTVRFDLTEPVPWFPELLASNVVTPVPSAVVRRFGARWTQAGKLAVSGPFRVLSGRGRSELILTRNAKWWGASGVRLTRLKLLAITQAAASPLFRGERLDVGLRDTSVHPTLLEGWLKDPRLRTVPSQDARYLFLNTAAGPLAAPNVRRAIALAIDREELTQLTSHGVDAPLETVVPSGVRGSSSTFGSPLLQPDGAARTSAAIAELAGGWPSGQRFDLYYLSDPSSFDVKVATRISTDLAAAGIPVSLHPVTAASFRKVGTGVAPVGSGVDGVLDGWTSSYSDPQSFLSLLSCEAAVTGGRNLAGFCDSTFDSLLSQARASSGSARVDALRTAESLLTGATGAMPVVPLYEPMGEYLVQPWVHGFVQDPKGTVAFERIRVSAH